MAMTTGVVLVRTGSSYRVYTDAGEVTAVLRGKLRRRDDDDFARASATLGAGTARRR